MDIAPTDLRTAVANRIRSTFVELIPEDQWKKLVDSQISAILQKRGYQKDQASELEEAIRSVVIAALKEKVKQELESKDYWPEGTASRFVVEYVTANKEAMIAAAFSWMIQEGLSHLRAQIDNDLRQRLGH